MSKLKRPPKRRFSPRHVFDHDAASVQLAGAEAALQVAILAMENKGVLSSVAFTLRAHVLFPLGMLKDEISGKSAALRAANHRAHT